jgi:hypothetical protein
LIFTSRLESFPGHPGGHASWHRHHLNADLWHIRTVA